MPHILQKNLYRGPVTNTVAQWLFASLVAVLIVSVAVGVKALITP
jgi:hypothetical protein